MPFCNCGAGALESNDRLSEAHNFRTLQGAGAREFVQHWQWESSLASKETYRLLQAGPLYKPSWHLSSCRLNYRWLHMQVHHTINASRHHMSRSPSSPRSETSRRGSAESLHRLTPMPSAAMSWQRGCGFTQTQACLVLSQLAMLSFLFLAATVPIHPNPVKLDSFMMACIMELS